MVKEGEFIDYIINLPIELSTEMALSKDLAVKVKELETENIELNVRLLRIEKVLGL